ncbi:bcl-2-like protein 11 [Lampris incognitus]|uniref:bcl-2-like protein 11 n=1 Tax=Lampris incognitus TaxID=2546036 RepID=UPI0024B52EB3|nr:bcl-2-like protein 11 [Lampris incognitus]
MSDKPRQPNWFNDASPVERGGDRGELVPVGGSGDEASAEIFHSNSVNENSEPCPGGGSSSAAAAAASGLQLSTLPRAGTKNYLPPSSLQGFQSRAPVFRSLSRSSSGYSSFDADSVPSSPFLPRPEVADKATQTPSPSCQVMMHALQRTASPGAVPAAQWPGHLHGSPSNLPLTGSSRSQNAAQDMDAEILVGRQLRQIGDHFNNAHIHRRLAGRRGWVGIYLHPLPRIHQEPAFLLGMVLLLLLIGRLIYTQDRGDGYD